MAQPIGNKNSAATLSTLDQEALAYLMSIRDSLEVQNDPDVKGVFDRTISSVTKELAKETPSRPTPIFTKFGLVPSIQIDTSGEDGDNGFNGTAASSSGAKGLSGTDGSEGTSALDIHLKLMRKGEFVALLWDYGNASMRLGEAAASIFLRSVGGCGGRGGNGGKGAHGTQGASGRDASRSSAGTNGKKGAQGGRGGHGGEGSDGGKGGNIRVDVSSEDSDLLMLINTPEVTGGASGKGGSGGKGGVGGSGGEGGSSHRWTETQQKTRTVWDVMERRNRTEYYTETSHGYNPGGVAGPDGRDGDHGKNGTDGKEGADGSFQIIVGGNVYQTMYDLAVSVSKIVDLKRENPADIYEPGELVNLMLSVTNTGGMPTPPHDVEVSIRSEQWMEQETFFSQVLKGSECLPIGGSHTFSTPCSFRIRNEAPLTGEPLDKQEALIFQALLRRINKCFLNVNRQKNLISVRYPVEISSLNGKVMTAFNEESTLSLSIHNISSIIMGKSGPQGRRVFVTFEVLENENVKASDVKLVARQLPTDREARYHQEQNKITVEVDRLNPQSKKQLGCSFRFTNSNLRDQSKLDVIALLYLDCFNPENDKQLGQVRCIQKRSIQMLFSNKGRF
jgi:hypothetical protein